MGNQSSKTGNLEELAKTVFNNPAGEKFLSAWEDTFANRRSFTPGDQYGTAFKEGQRDNARYLIQLGRSK